MSHIAHIAKNKESLDKRFALTKAIREFFWSMDFQEVETPLLLRLPGQEPYLTPMRALVHDETGKGYDGYLHTSPEYSLKKMLAAGFGNIFSICKCFRDHESFGGSHNPEFTMIEWYRPHADFTALMDDCEQLYQHLAPLVSHTVQPVTRVHMRDLWKETIGVDLDNHLTHQTMLELCKQRGYKPEPTEPFEDLFYRIFLSEIEPTLTNRGAVIVHHYPTQMAALAKISDQDEQYAERFELYMNGMEIANAFTELTDAIEQRQRFEDESKRRLAIGKTVFDVDEHFLTALEHMPPTAGIALGVDRLIQVLTGCQNIDDVLVLPASKLFRPS